MVEANLAHPVREAFCANITFIKAIVLVKLLYSNIMYKYKLMKLQNIPIFSCLTILFGFIPSIFSNFYPKMAFKMLFSF